MAEIQQVTDPTKIVTDPVLLSVLAKQGIDSNYVEFYQDYAPAYVGGEKVKGQSPYAKFYRDLRSGKRFMVASRLPMVDADSVPIDCRWVQSGQVYQEKNNLFHILVHDTNGKIKIQVKNDQPDGRKANHQLSCLPQIFLSGEEIKEPFPVLLPADPQNSSYSNNTLIWDYGICKRYLRLIEGCILGRWEFPGNPNGDVRIVYNQSGDFRLRLGRFATDSDTEMIPSDVFNNPLKYFPHDYPIAISDSATFYPDANPETSSVDEKPISNMQVVAAYLGRLLLRQGAQVL